MTYCDHFVSFTLSDDKAVPTHCRVLSFIASWMERVSPTRIQAKRDAKAAAGPCPLSFSLPFAAFAFPFAFSLLSLSQQAKDQESTCNGSLEPRTHGEPEKSSAEALSFCLLRFLGSSFISICRIDVGTVCQDVVTNAPSHNNWFPRLELFPTKAVLLIQVASLGGLQGLRFRL